MEYPYKNQELAKRKLSIGDYILFSYDGGGINSGVVEDLSGHHAKISDINGEGDMISVEINSITLYYDTQWDDAEDSDWECPVCGSEDPRNAVKLSRCVNGVTTELGTIFNDLGTWMSYCPSCKTVFMKGVDEE